MHFGTSIKAADGFLNCLQPRMAFLSDAHSKVIQHSRSVLTIWASATLTSGSGAVCRANKAGVEYHHRADSHTV